jgi:hypothetical protein
MAWKESRSAAHVSFTLLGSDLASNGPGTFSENFTVIYKRQYVKEILFEVFKVLVRVNPAVFTKLDRTICRHEIPT